MGTGRAGAAGGATGYRLYGCPVVRCGGASRKGRRNAEEGVGGGCGGDEPGIKDETPPPFEPPPKHPGCERPRRRTRGRAQDGSSRHEPLSASGLRQPESTFGDLNERWT